MLIDPAKRLDAVPPYAFAELAQKIRALEEQGHSVIRLDMGSPDLPPHPGIVEALCQSARQAGHHGYGGFSGIAALRQAFADYYQRRFGVVLDPTHEILPLIGSKEGIVNLALAVLNPGDVVLVPGLAYPAYAGGAHLAGAEVFEVPLDPNNNYQPILDAIPKSVLKRVRIMWVNYPHNPTGTVATLADLERIAEFCHMNRILLCSDNPYAEIAFDGIKPPSLMQVADAKQFAIEFNSLSKTFNMAGWRIGVCVGNRTAISALAQVKSNIDSGIFRPIQDAACFALTEVGDEWISERNLVYQARRDTVVEKLAVAGLTAVAPEGGIYVWGKVLDRDDEAYASAALESAFVSLTAGSVYGRMGQGYVRISLVTAKADIATAMDRLRDHRIYMMGWGGIGEPK